MKITSFLGLIFGIILVPFGQDIGVVAKIAPNSGCQLGSSLTVTVQVFNFGPTFTSPFDVSYQVDANTPVTETVNLGTFNASSSYSHTFATDVDLSATGSYVLKFYTTLGGDSNNNNDTITATIVNDPYSVGGNLPLDFSVCELGNSGTLNLSSYTGDVLDWEITTNGGTSWNSLSNTTDSEAYLNITQTTGYRAIVKSGTCPNDTSTVVNITVDPESIGGTSSGPGSICPAPNAAAINLIGEQGSILDWEFSTDGGVTWNALGDNSNPLNQTNLAQTTSYRAEVQSGSCPAVYSDTTEVIVISNLNGGDLDPLLDSVCITSNSGSLNLLNSLGAIDHWESSTDLVSWNTISNTTTSHSFSNLLDTTYFRVIVSGCTFDTSTVAQINVSDVSVAGTIASAMNACEGNDLNGLSASGSQGNSYSWETSLDGSNWASSGNQASFNIIGISQSQFVRFITTNGACPADTSNTLSISVSSAPSYSSVLAPDSLCISSNVDSIVYSGINNSVVDWIYSEDAGVSWNALSQNDSVLNIAPIINTTYGVLVSSGTCPVDTFYHDVVVSQNSIAGSIPTDTTICEYINTVSITNSGYMGEISWYASSSMTGPYTLIGSGSASSSVDVSNYGYVYAEIENEVCPAVSTDTMSIEFYPSNYGIIGDTLVSQNTPTEIEAFGGTSYLWNANSYMTDVTNANQTVELDVAYTFTVEITDANGCIYQDSIFINLLDEDFEIATIMTPNNDGFNDEWMIQAPSSIGMIKVTITNSFGQVVYSNNDYQNDWLGDFGGSTLPSGAYFYLVETEEYEPFYGTLNILTNE